MRGLAMVRPPHSRSSRRFARRESSPAAPHPRHRAPRRWREPRHHPQAARAIATCKPLCAMPSSLKLSPMRSSEPGGGERPRAGKVRPGHIRCFAATTPGTPGTREDPGPRLVHRRPRCPNVIACWRTGAGPGWSRRTCRGSRRGTSGPRRGRRPVRCVRLHRRPRRAACGSRPGPRRAAGRPR